MATPIYKGAAQPTAAGGWLSGIGSWFGGGTPAYAGSGQPTTGSGGSATPAYAAAPSQTTTPPPSGPTSCTPPDQITIVLPRELVAPQQ